MVLWRGRSRRRQPASHEPVNEPEDPLLRAWAPPAHETPAQRALREAQEEEARVVSERIDNEISKDRTSLQGKKSPVKVVLVGHEGSGKASFLKGFWESYAPQTWQTERLVWSAVIRLYLIRSVTKILDVLDNASETPHHHIELLRLRLSPLRRAQHYFEEYLGLPKGEDMSAAAITKLAKRRRNDAELHLDEAVESIIACRDDMAVLFKDEDVRAKLETHEIRPGGHSPYILENIHRITKRGYEPSGEDITWIRSTMPGVPEYHVTVERDMSLIHSEWIFYDVGCPSTHRASWLSYFTDVNAIVFYVPISTFDEWIDEDQGTDRLGDYLRVWSTICKSELLEKIELILILNGCDVLRDKLKQGVSMRDFIASYGNRPNDAESVMHYIRTRFMGVSHRDVSRKGHKVHIHHAADSDSDASIARVVVTHVHQSIMNNHLLSAPLI